MGYKYKKGINFHIEIARPKKKKLILNLTPTHSDVICAAQASEYFKAP